MTTKVLPFKTRFTVEARPVVVTPGEEKRTKSEFAKDCDINLIMARYKKTGLLPESARAAAAQYGDFSELPTFAEMQERTMAANELFAALPATVRKQFDNDPGQFLAAADTKEGRELMVKLGLGKPVEAQPPSQPDSSSSGPAAAPAKVPAKPKGKVDEEV